MGDEIKVPGYKTVVQQQLTMDKETRSSILFDVEDDPYGEAFIQNVYIRKAAFRSLGGGFADASKVTVLVLVRES